MISGSHFQELRGKYLHDIKIMTDGEMDLLLDSASKGDFEHRERMIEKIENEKTARKKRRESNEREKAEWIKAAEEYKRMTEKWESLGATWKCIEKNWVVWYYQGERFYDWTSGDKIIDNIQLAREADKRLMKRWMGCHE